MVIVHSYVNVYHSERRQRQHFDMALCQLSSTRLNEKSQARPITGPPLQASDVLPATI
jgi:hypothetical protein